MKTLLIDYPMNHQIYLYFFNEGGKVSKKCNTTLIGVLCEKMTFKWKKKIKQITLNNLQKCCFKNILLKNQLLFLILPGWKEKP